jgi:hypothetical protein
MGVDPKIPEMLFSVRDITISVVAGALEEHLRETMELVVNLDEVTSFPWLTKKPFRS